jgi:hypothetical protein
MQPTALRIMPTPPADWCGADTVRVSVDETPRRECGDYIGSRGRVNGRGGSSNDEDEGEVMKVVFLDESEVWRAS